MTGADEITELFCQVQREVAEATALVDVAEDEIAQAIKRHPDAADDLFHAYPLLLPAIVSRAWSTEFVLRGHCRELLERVATGQDTRPSTTVECLLAMAEVSKAIPLGGAAGGFYFRMWHKAFPEHELSDRGPYYEAIYRGRINEIEKWTRKKLAIPGRVLKDVECDGLHHGEPVPCKYRTEGAE
jgi:hypothetical protein